MSEAGIRDRVRRTSHSRPVRVLARTGLFASGLVHVLIGGLGLATIIGGFRGNADQSGALDLIANTPGGVIVLLVATVGLLGLALWQVTGATTGRQKEMLIPRWLRNSTKALGYAGVGFACLLFAVGAHLGGADSTRSFSTWLIEVPGGVFVLAAVGAVVGGVGVAFVFRGVRRNFLEDVAPPRNSVGVAVITLGVIGHIMKGLALLLVGVLFVAGAISTDSTWASGLDGAIRWLAERPTGPWPLVAVAAGFVVHGLYLAARGVFIRR